MLLKALTRCLGSVAEGRLMIFYLKKVAASLV